MKVQNSGIKVYDYEFESTDQQPKICDEQRLFDFQQHYAV